VNLRGQPSMNGKVEAPSFIGGASAVSAQRTIFPEVHLTRTAQTLFYWLSRHFLAGISLWRWLLGTLLVLALLWGVAGLPGQWWVTLLVLLGCSGAVAWFFYWRRRDYVYFSPLPRPGITPSALAVADKVAIFVTGHLTVENKAQRFTWLPGFYRTFATREHAIMCHVKQQSYLGLGHWPENEVGLWYLFFSPQELVQLDWGNLTFGREVYLAIAVTYQRTIPARGRFQPERVINEIVYLAVASEDDGKQILADLLADQTLMATSAGRAQFTRNNG
jgi:hypothetical protein